MSQTGASIRSISLLASVAVHAAVLANIPGLIGETGTGPAESSSTLHINVLRSEPADDISRDNPDRIPPMQASAQPRIHASLSEKIVQPVDPLPAVPKTHAIATTETKQDPKNRAAPSLSVSQQPTTNKTGADTKERRPMQVATSGKYARQSRDYRSTLLRLIERHKYYPLRARRSGIEGKATVSFTVSNNGEIRNVVIARSSHRPILDQAALQTIKRIGQAPPLPDGRNRWQFTVPMAYHIH